MPHLILEYSSDLENKIEFPPLLKGLSHRLIELGPFNLKDVKARAISYEKFLVGAEANQSFLHLTLLILEGRDSDTRKRVSQGMLDYLTKSCRKTCCSFTVELREMNRETYSKLVN